jgi:hypothetical protein
MRVALAGIVVCLFAVGAQAERKGTCSIVRENRDGKMSFRMDLGECDTMQHCHSNSMNSMDWSRWEGITADDLRREGEAIDARRKAEAGEIRCVGTVHGGELHGSYTFTPDAGFLRRMEGLGFAVRSEEQQFGYAMLDVTTEWTRAMKDARVSGMTVDNLPGLRALGVDSEYVQGMAKAGYPELEADKLTGMKAVGVSPEKVKAVRAMGFSPTEDQLIQMSVFQIDAPFVQRMKARGFKNPTVAQLVQIKIFKLDE